MTVTMNPVARTGYSGVPPVGCRVSKDCIYYAIVEISEGFIYPSTDGLVILALVKAP